jgi:hypothetical protein
MKPALATSTTTVPVVCACAGGAARTTATIAARQYRKVPRALSMSTSKSLHQPQHRPINPHTLNQHSPKPRWRVLGNRRQ